MTPKEILDRVTMLREIQQYDHMKELTCSCGTTIEEVFRCSRQKNHVRARGAMAYYLKTTFGWSDERLAEFFGFSSPSSAWYSVKKYKQDAGIP